MTEVTVHSAKARAHLHELRSREPYAVIAGPQQHNTSSQHKKFLTTQKVLHNIKSLHNTKSSSQHRKSSQHKKFFTTPITDLFPEFHVTWLSEFCAGQKKDHKHKSACDSSQTPLIYSQQEYTLQIWKTLGLYLFISSSLPITRSLIQRPVGPAYIHTELSFSLCAWQKKDHKHMCLWH
jgi:hypothetical protein